METLKNLASNFKIGTDILSVDTLGEGFINDTFMVKTPQGYPDYILQRKNHNVFPDIEGMMENILKVTAHIRKKIAGEGGDPSRETLTVVETHSGKPYHIDDDGQYWVVTKFIDGAVTYPKADSGKLAAMGGKGIGKFQRYLNDFELPLHDTIPGFHDIRHRFAQWNATLERDAARRKSSLSAEIGWIESRKERMLQFKKLIEDGVIPPRVTHNDTKISNILFDTDENVLCVIDLDTVMRSTSLYDFGDAIRSYANTGEEDAPDTSTVGLSLPMFRAYTEGFLSERRDTLTQPEIDNLAFSALYITYEQVLRFLMDYIDGDTYYKIKYPEHNLVRTHAQYALLLDMERNLDRMRAIVAELAR